MKSGVCPKCKGQNVYSKDPIEGTYDERSRISVKGTLKALLIELYLCADCGYLEEYCKDDEKRLSLVKQHWNKVGPRA